MLVRKFDANGIVRDIDFTFVDDCMKADMGGRRDSRRETQDGEDDRVVFTAASARPAALGQLHLVPQVQAVNLHLCSDSDLDRTTAAAGQSVRIDIP